MASLTLFVGLDYHQSSVQVCAMDASGKVLVNRRCPNCRQTIVAVVRRFGERVRAVLMEAAHRLMRYEDRWIRLGHSLKSHGKANSLVVVAVANRWIRWLYHQMPSLDLAA